MLSCNLCWAINGLTLLYDRLLNFVLIHSFLFILYICVLNVVL